MQNVLVVYNNNIYYMVNLPLIWTHTQKYRKITVYIKKWQN